MNEQTKRPQPADDSDGPVLSLLLWLVPLGVVAATYHAVTRNYFHLDDFLHLYNVVNQPLGPYLLEPFGGHLYVARNAVFALFYHAFGTWASGYFWIVLLTHLLNVALLVHVIRLLSGSTRLAAALATLWGASPVHDEVLGWYSVYGQVLVATILLLFLVQVARAETAAPRHFALAAVGWWVLLLVGTTCFGNGIAVAMAAPLVALLLLPPGRRRRQATAILLSLWIVVPILYFADTWFYGGGDAAVRPLFAHFTAARYIAEMVKGLLAHGIVTAHAAVFRVPLSMASATVALWTAAVGVALAVGPPVVRRRILACLLLALATYAAIAAGRAAGQATFHGPSVLQQSARVPRYHYVGSLPLAIASGIALAALPFGARLSKRAGNVALGLVLALVLAVQVLAPVRINHHDYARRATDELLRTIHSLADARPPGEVVVIPNRPFSAAPPRWLVPATVLPGWAAIFTIFFPDHRVDGRAILFVESDPEVLEAARDGLRSPSLLIPPP